MRVYSHGTSFCSKWLSGEVESAIIGTKDGIVCKKTSAVPIIVSAIRYQANKGFSLFLVVWITYGSTSFYQ